MKNLSVITLNLSGKREKVTCNSILVGFFLVVLGFFCGILFVWLVGFGFLFWFGFCGFLKLWFWGFLVYFLQNIGLFYDLDIN